MRHRTVISLVLVVIFISPMLSNNGTFLSNDNNYSGIPESMTNYVNSADPYSGTGPSLPVSLTGIATDRLGGSLQIDASTSDIHTITLDDGWTGSNLQTTIDSLSVDISDVLVNPSLDSYHPEKWFVGSTSNYADDVYVPDGWTIVKDVVDYDSLHPLHGMYELDSDSNGKDGTRGIYIEAQLTSGYVADPNDEMYMSQLVSMPYRELYSAQITFDYRVSSSSDMDDKIHLFIRLAGSTTKFNVFESGDTTDTWLTASVTIQASSMTDLATKVMLFDIGFATDESGVLGVTSNAYAYLDNVQLDLVVRPFPEQIDLKVNGTAVVGSISDSIYQYEPDDDTRDAWDLEGSGLNLNGNPYESGDADLFMGVYSASDWTAATTHQSGIQFPVDIPQGAVITSAYLEVEPIATDGNPTMRIYVSGFNSSGGNIIGFTPGLPQLEDRLTWVETSIDWDARTWDSSVRIRHRSPEIAPLIQNIVSDVNWTTGNYVCIMLDYLWSSASTSTNSFKGAYGSTYSEDEFPRLFVEYMIPLPEDTVYFMQYEKDITIDSSMTSAILNDFPVLIEITDSDLAADAQADGDDIIFKIDGEAVDFEIEYFDQASGNLTAWVKVPTLYATRDTVITMAYGNPNSGPSSSAKAWDDFETVHHLADDPSGTVYDSTANNYDGTSFGGMTSGNLVSGIAGEGINFDYDFGTVANSDMINIGQIFTDDWSSFTVSLWVYMDIADDVRVFSKSSSTNPLYHILTTRLAAQTLNVRLWTDEATGSNHAANTSFALSNWQHLVWSWDASSSTVLGFMNGVAILSESHTGNDLQDSNDVFVIANNNMETSASEERFFDGILDEIRLTQSLRSADWIAAEFNNQNDPSSYLSVGSERTLQSSWTDTESTTVRFSTTSSTPVDIFPIVTMDISAGGQTLDENMEEGTSFYVANDTVVEWTANVLVSPPPDADSLNVVVDYPFTEWKPLTVTNPIGQVKTYGSDWTFHDGSVIVYADAVDIWGVWTIEFESWNYVYDMKLGPTDESDYDTYSFNVNDDAEFKISSPWIENARAGLVLTDPDGNIWHTAFATTGTPGTTWDIPSFSYRMQLSVPAAQVDADVTNFPLLVSFADSDFQTDVQADGDDFVFVQNNEVLAHEIDRFEPITGRLVAWVRANLSSTVDNTLWLYYGNPVIGSTESPETLWSNGYEAVWLLNEDVTNEGSGGLHIDSTSNGYIGTQDGNSLTSGIANGYGQSFDGNDWITIDSTESLQPAGDVTISGWFYLDSAWSAASTPSQLIVSKYLDGDTNFHIALVGSDYTESGVAAGSLAFGFENNLGEYTKWTTRVSWAAGWYHFACVMDADTPANNKIYINGADNTDAGSAGGASSVSLAFDADWGIGGRYVETSEFPTGEAFHTGSIDEIRIATTPRAAGWFAVEYDTSANFGSFVDSSAAEETRTSPEHTISKVIDSTAPAGLWTASFYYNDTGAAVSYKTGLYERNFIVKHDSSLSLINPADAVGDKTAYKVAGDILYVEVELTDDIGAGKITGAAVTMNWSVSGTPTELTLNDIGNGRYGISVDTADLGDAGQYRINIESYHQFYNNATDYFDLELYHATELDFTDVDSTPVGFEFTATLIFNDTYDGTPITGATITFENGTAVNVVAEGAGRYNISLNTGSLSYGDHVFVFKATKAGAYLEEGSVTITFTLRKHFTSVSVIGDLVTPYGDTTELTIVITDTDTGAILSASDVSSFLLDPASYGNTAEASPADLIVDLDTSAWSVGTDTVTLSVVMTGNYFSPSNYLFDIQIRNHYTSVTVIGDLISPYGTTTSLTIVITDTDTGATLSSSDVSSFLLDPASYGNTAESSPGDLLVDLDTSTWLVGSDTITLSVIMSGNYYNPSNYLFNIQIRNHYTSVAVIGDLISPYGTTTSLTIVITDTDTGATLSSSDVSSFLLDPASYGNTAESNPTDLLVDLNTVGWSVGTDTVTLSVVMTGNYDNPSNYVFDIQIRNHHTSVTVLGDLTTPYGQTTALTIVITDTDTGLTLTSSAVTSFTFTPSSYGSQGDPSPSDLDFLLVTSGWSVATETVTLSVVMSGNYNNPTDYDFDIIIRNHYTTITVTGNLVTAYGETTLLTIVITDSDTGTILSASDVSSFLLDPASYSNHTESNPSDLIVDLDTSSWSVATETVTLSLVMTGNYDNPSNYIFNIQIRDRLTSITVTGNLETPYGNITSLTIVITDLDSGTTLSASDVSSFTLTPSSYGSQSDPSPSDLVYDLDTSIWSIGGETVTLSIVMTDNYQNPTNYVFTITIRTLDTTLYNAPSNLLFTQGSDFTIDVHFNVSEAGPYYGDPITGEAGQFVVTSSLTLTGTTVNHIGDGLYRIVIPWSNFDGQGTDFTIDIDVNPSSIEYASASLVVSFQYREIISDLTANLYTVSTPYNMDVTIHLYFTDRDSSTGITTAIISANSTINSQSHVADGDYLVELDVSSFGIGSHDVNLSASASGYVDKWLIITIVVTKIHTDAEPTTIRLEIPSGNSEIFYIEWTDLDNGVSLQAITENHNWTGNVAPTFTYLAGEGRYQMTFTTDSLDTLGTYLVWFSFSIDGNYQDGYCEIQVEIRSHDTILTSDSPPPTALNALINITMYYYDFDDKVGIHDLVNVQEYVFEDASPIVSNLIVVGSGYYIVQIDASTVGLGLHNFTVYINWTGAIQQYENKFVFVSVSVVGVDSQMTLTTASDPSAYNETMTYIFLYSEKDSGIGITNSTDQGYGTGHVHISVSFDAPFDSAKVTISEVGSGYYQIDIDTTGFGQIGQFSMTITINWDPVDPYYSDRDDTVSVWVLARDTLLLVNPPSPVSYGEDATFTFSWEDTALSSNIQESGEMDIAMNVTFGYVHNSGIFTITIDTTQFGDMGTYVMTLDLTWAGAPFYANRTSQISITVLARQTVLDYPTPNPTFYSDNVTIIITWTDVTNGASDGILGAEIRVFDEGAEIPSNEYDVRNFTGGVYEIEFSTSRFSATGLWNITIEVSRPETYILTKSTSRFLDVRQRNTITSSEPINTVPYSSSFTVILYYQDIITLDVIGNDSSQVTFDILNGSSWIYTIVWNPSMEYYELTVQTSNQPLTIGSVYSLHVNMSYGIFSPFYKHDDAYISFEIRSRASSLERQLAPIPTPYLDNVTFTIYFSDADDLSPITSADIYIFKGPTQLTLGTEYFFEHLGVGVYEIIVRSTALDDLGVTAITVQANWTGGSPFHDDVELDINLTVTERTTNVEIVTPPVQTNYLENVTFVISFIDHGTGLEIAATKDLVEIYNGAVLLTPAQFSMTQITAYTYEISINSTVLSAELVTNRIITVHIDWPYSPIFYKDDSTSTSATTIARSTYVSVDRPGNTPYGENATFTFSFIDSTTLPEVLVESSIDMITFNLNETPSLSYNAVTRLFTVSFNTSQFGDVGLAAFYINVTWAGSPYYSNKTLQLVYVTVTMRQTQVYFEAPAPTPYGDVVAFDVSYLDISGASEVGISDGTLKIYYFVTDSWIIVPGVNYILTPDGSGNFEIQFSTDFFSEPGLYNLNVSLVYTGGYFRNDASAARTLNVRYRTTILSANPVGQIGYETTLEITLFYQDILTLADIDDTFTTFTILNDTGTPWVYTITWQPASSTYLLEITTVGQATLILGDHALWINMSYANQDPFYRWDYVYVEFTIRTRTSALDLQEAAIPAPFQENISFVVYYWDADVTQSIAGATFIIEESGVGILTLNSDYFVVDGAAGVYTILIDSTVLGGLNTYSISVTAVWPGGAPYHNNAQRDVSVTTIQRTATVDILEPANQPRYLDNVVFTFAYIDLINGAQIGITSTDVSIYADGTFLTGGIDYVLTPDGSAFIVTINSTVLSATLVSDFNVTVYVTWDGSSPFYTNDGTSMKVSTTERIILVEPQQIETTPVHDWMNITFFLIDEDNDNPVSGAIIVFSCVNPARTLNEGAEYTLVEYAPGKYLISINTDALVFAPGDLGDFIFELEVQWNPSNSPYYKNKSPISLTGSVDLIWTNIVSGVPTPASVRITDNVSIVITVTDLDHGQGVSLPINQIFVTYYGTAITPSVMTITYLGSGDYSIEFSTIDLNDFVSQTMNITIDYYPYTAMIVNPSFTVTRIDTTLTPLVTEITLNWTESAYVEVDYENLLNLNLTSGASLNWTYGAASGAFTEIGTTGTYYAWVNSSFADAGTGVVTIRAIKDKYQYRTITVTLIVLSLRSELIIETPDAVFTHYRGDPINVTVYLTDVHNGGIPIYTGVTNVSMIFEGVTYYLTQNVTDSSYWYTTLPTSATDELDPGLIYSARIIADSVNYDPASSVFKIDLLATATTIHLVDIEDNRLDVVYNEVITFYLNYTESVSGFTIDNGTIRWFDQSANINETFTFNPLSGLWELEFNTSKLSYGTWGVTFDGIPAESDLAEDRVDFAITVKKITTEVISPIPDQIYWGWVGNITFFYNDTYFITGIDNATAEYSWGPFSGNAVDLGNGYYSVLINTTYLDSGVRYTVTIDFTKPNYQVSAGSISLYIDEVPTEVQLSTPSDNQIEDEIDELKLPFGDSILISFFYNDTDDSDGYVGGLSGATITATIFGGGLATSINFDVVDLGNGTYYFIFDSTATELFELQSGIPQSLPGTPFYIRLEIILEHRESYTAQNVIPLSIEIIDRPTTLVFDSDIVADGSITMYYGDIIEILVRFDESWIDVSGNGITNAMFNATPSNPETRVQVNTEATSEPGVYLLTIQVDAQLIMVGYGTAYEQITIVLSLDNYEQQKLELSVRIDLTDEQETMNTVISYATPSFLLLILAAVLWTRHFSIPKRLRQINGQIKALKKGKIPKPVEDSKSRQELVAELFNDTFQKLEITRQAIDMPDVAVPIKVPEIRELLIQLSILTHLSPEELDEFNADISKMKMSEQAAFVKEVINQEAIRAARAKGITIEEVLEQLAAEASGKISATDEIEEAKIILDEPVEERVFLDKDELPTEEPEPIIETPSDEAIIPTEKLSQFEIDELKADLIKKGVPIHEIDTIIEQAGQLSRDLVEELIKSLGLKD